jgi:plastocyanin
MVFIAPFIGAVALLSTLAAAVPTPQYSSGSSSSDSSSYSPPSSSDDSSSSSYGSSSYGSSGSSGSSDSSSYGSSSGSSYGSSGSSYGSSGSGYGGSNESSAPPSYNTQTQESTSTSSAYVSYSTPSYGSGMSSWGGSGYDDCVSQCIASYGAPPSSYTPPSMSDDSSSSSSSGSSGSGATHTVIVAPTQGVLRYVPFALNASVGDTVMFMWGANNHTVTKSSELLPCNKSLEAPVFASGTQNESFMFSQVVNDTSPTFFYCGTPTHCEKGMFGIINPPNAFGASTSLGMALPAMAANDSGMAALMTTNNMMTANSSAAASWGMNIDLAGLPTWSHSLVAENAVYTRSFLAQNPEVLNADGSVNLSQAGANPLMIPQDISTAIDASSANGTSTASTSSASSSGATSSAPAASTSAKSAAGITSPSMLIAFVAVVATVFAL